MPISSYPDDAIEKDLIGQGKIVCGIDEVGRGSWAGPLVIACVIPGDGTINGVRDSKKISVKKREELSNEIHKWANGIGIGMASNLEIDSLGLSQCLTLASNMAIENATINTTRPNYILLDGAHNFVKNNLYEVQTIVKGDNVSHVIAAASIVAKVFRDKLMAEMDLNKYGVYNFAKNKGYPSPEHRQALKEYGPCDLHRISWNIFSDINESYKQEALA